MDTICPACEGSGYGIGKNLRKVSCPYCGGRREVSPERAKQIEVEINRMADRAADDVRDTFEAFFGND